LKHVKVTNNKVAEDLSLRIFKKAELMKIQLLLIISVWVISSSFVMAQTTITPVIAPAKEELVIPESINLDPMIEMKPEVEFITDQVRTGLQEIHGGRNGGDGLEIDIRIMAQKIASFLTSDLGVEAFQEINLAHLKNVMEVATFFVTTETLIDRYGVTRTCVNEQQIMRITCDANRWALIKDPRVFYVLVFHEILGLMNLELGYHRDVSMYPISYRLINYINEVENSEFGQEVLRQEFFTQDRLGYGLTLFNRKSDESIRMICLDNVPNNRCQRFSLVRKLDDFQAPLDIRIKDLTKDQLRDMHRYLETFKRKPYLKRKDFQSISIAQDIINFNGRLALTAKRKKRNMKNFESIERLIIHTLNSLATEEQ
jgi:hypothetical protein